MKALLIVLLAVAAFGAGFMFDRWQHRPIILQLSTVDGRHYHIPVEPNTSGPLHAHGAEAGVCGAFGALANYCQYET